MRPSPCALRSARTHAVEVPTPPPSMGVLPSAFVLVGSSCSTRVIVIVTGVPSGSVTPRMSTFTGWWFGGQIIATFGEAAVHTGGEFAGGVASLTVHVNVVLTERPPALTVTTGL